MLRLVQDSPMLQKLGAIIDLSSPDFAIQRPMLDAASHRIVTGQEFGGEDSSRVADALSE